MSEYYFRTADLDVGYNGKTLIHDIAISLTAGDTTTTVPTAPNCTLTASCTSEIRSTLPAPTSRWVTRSSSAVN